MTDQEAAVKKKHIRQIEVLAEARTVHGWRKQVTAGQRGEKWFTFYADEGSYMPGGEGTAPTPLACFTESALTHTVEVKTSHLFNGQAIDISTVES